MITFIAPHAEPNSLPNIFDNWLDWRMAYAEHVKDYNKSEKTYSDGLLLEIRLKKLGFVGLNLHSEVAHVKEASK